MESDKTGSIKAAWIQQGEQQAVLPERIFVYNYRIYDRYRRPVASLVVLADNNAAWKPDCYGFEVFGCKHWLEFPIAKLTDYHDRLGEWSLGGRTTITPALLAH